MKCFTHEIEGCPNPNCRRYRDRPEPKTEVPAGDSSSATHPWARGHGVAVFLRMPTGGVYMAKRLAKNRPFCGMYAAPGGSVEDGETPDEAAMREVLEETGLMLTERRLHKLGKVGPIITPVEQQGSGMPYFMTYYLADVGVGELPKITEPEKQGPWEFRMPSNWIFNAQLVPGSSEMLEMIRKIPLGLR